MSGIESLRLRRNLAIIAQLCQTAHKLVQIGQISCRLLWWWGGIGWGLFRLILGRWSAFWGIPFRYTHFLKLLELVTFCNLLRQYDIKLFSSIFLVHSKFVIHIY